MTLIKLYAYTHRQTVMHVNLKGSTNCSVSDISENEEGLETLHFSICLFIRKLL